MSSPSPAADVVAVYHGDVCLGEAEVYFPNPNQKNFIPEEKEREWEREIRISYLSPPSERCPPLSVLHTISPFPLRCRLRGRANSPIAHLHHSCFQHRQTAVALIADQELHLVAMPSKLDNAPSFWCCSVRPGMYASCLAMLNLRCLAIVFDLDETLIVANTMKSFEDRIEALSRWIDAEHDPARISLMSAELKRYLEDRELLKQYIETDSVSDGGRLVRVQNEEVPLIPGAQDRILRPIIRLQEKNIVLTRINPEIRDTSVLVRLRPAWEDLRSYLTAKGRKRFEVYVCTMAERDYALEMWRFLDPEAYLINSKQLLDRVVCVKAGSRKSLLHVFQDGLCHPKMAMVIDHRLKVWDDKDQPRVHVVPAFSPYHAPQLEAASAVAILCVARNVACNVRGGFFKEFDENLLRRVFELCYENELLDLPYAPDVSDFLMTEDTGPTLNINKDVPILDGINATEVERTINQQAFIGDEQPVKQQAQPTNSSFTGEEVKGAQQQPEEQQLLVVGSYCHDVLFRDGRLIGETLGGAAAFISNVLGALSSSSSHCYISKVGPDFAYAVPCHQHHPPPPLAAASSTASTTLFHAHFSSSSQKAPSGHGDRVLKRVRACDPILPSDLPSAPARFAVGLAVGVAGEIPPETLARMLDLCQVLIVDVQALIRTFDPVDGTVSLVPLRDTAFFPLLNRITFLKASAEEAPFLNRDDARKSGCRLVITEGKGGCRLCCHYGDLHVPAFPAAVQVDPTGAGDSFLGGFTAGLLSGLSVPASALLGNFFGSITVGQIGIPKIDPRMLQKIKEELQKRSVHCVGLHGENDLVDSHAWDVDEDFRASLDAITKLPCNYNLIEITDCNDEREQKLELKSTCGEILPIKPS